MSDTDIYKGLDQIYRKADPKNLRRGLECTFMHEILIIDEHIGTKAAWAINEAWQRSNGTTEEIVSNIEMIKYANETSNEWLMGTPDTRFSGLINVSVEREPGLDGIVVIGFGTEYMVNSSGLAEINKAFRKDLFDRYKKDHKGFGWDDQVLRPTLDSEGQPSNTLQSKTGKTIYTGGEHSSRMGDFFSEVTGFSHDEETNVAKASFIQHLESGAGGTHGVSTVDIAMEVFNSLGIYWEQTTKKLPGVGWKRVWVIKGELAGFNPKWQKGIDLGVHWTNRILSAVNKMAKDPTFLNKFGPASKASVPLLHTVRDSELKRVADEILKGGGFGKGGQKIKVKNMPKAPKPPKKSQKGNRKNTKAKSAKKKKIVNIPVTRVTSSGGKEKGKGKAASTEIAAGLARQMAYINSRLPAEVRRNMGRPALQNQTGRFSQSVELKSLHQAAQTVVAKYSYLLSPYSTFENTGKRRWPMSYNPKTLIAKSIRNLAQGRIEQKLTVRRV